MLRLFILVLFVISMPLSAHAHALTSIKVGDKNYNLVIFSDGEHAEPIKAFNAALKRDALPEVIDRCLFAIDMPAGTARGNHSYGGFCSYRLGNVTTRVMICADLMVGHLKMQTIEKYQYPDDAINLLAKFVADNCKGG